MFETAIGLTMSRSIAFILVETSLGLPPGPISRGAVDDHPGINLSSPCAPGIAQDGPVVTSPFAS
jgi:hypothetical protein